MPIRRIKAHYAIEEGDTLRIITKSNRVSSVMIAIFLAIIVSLIALSNMSYIAQLVFILLAGATGFLLGSGRIEREVPRVDIVEIKRYNWPPRVTVILDDERARMARPVQPPKPKDAVKPKDEIKPKDLKK
ncbi:hypothetical protein [Leucothrix arctica]|uniref:Uncharacterized protein n=1 Tax=Leucothrix arctica TaxID=1481894 RepID=A0A317CSX5_9GAMM|nr:hypothetical protein [Leucothrix arctica]PWQ99540.1 hypothetical protein DKT75_00275 [Leucothrix arctica]